MEKFRTKDLKNAAVQKLPNLNIQSQSSGNLKTTEVINKSKALTKDKVLNSNKIHLNKENVRVIVRIRPGQEKNESSLSCVRVISDENNCKKQIILEDPRHRGLPKRYEFDEIYDVDSTTELIYSKEIQSFVYPLLSECSCINVFAFGSSGTGKTFTMHGENDYNLGIIGLTIKQLLEINNSQSIPGRFSFSFFEVYCEKIQDLLSGIEVLGTSNKSDKNSTSSSNTEVSIRTDICGRVRVVGTKNFEFSSWDDFNHIYREALKKRVSGKTAVNSTSSRSHACIQINYIPPTIDIPEENKGIVGNEDTLENRKRRGSISFHVKPKINLNYPRTIVNLVDLSGFENNRITNNTGKRMIESTFINSSLLSLSKVINALKKNGGTHSVQSCIPYRESKLTRILQEYLGGGADPPYSPYCLRCIMICTISPSVTFFQQTYATLNTPSYGNTSAMRKFVGIVGSKSNLGKINQDSNLVSSETQCNDFITGSKSSRLLSHKYNKEKKNKHSSEHSSIRNSKEFKQREVSSSKTISYNKVESRVAQMIKGKIPFHSNLKPCNTDLTQARDSRTQSVATLSVKEFASDSKLIGFKSNSPSKVEVDTYTDNHLDSIENNCEIIQSSKFQDLSTKISDLNLSNSILNSAKVLNTLDSQRDNSQSSFEHSQNLEPRNLVETNNNQKRGGRSKNDQGHNCEVKDQDENISQGINVNSSEIEAEMLKEDIRDESIASTRSKGTRSQVKIVNRPVTRSQTKK